jgi:Bacterial sugar transferase
MPVLGGLDDVERAVRRRCPRRCHLSIVGEGRAVRLHDPRPDRCRLRRSHLHRLCGIDGARLRPFELGGQTLVDVGGLVRGPAKVKYWDDQLTARVRVMPGVTGLWQVSGRSNTSFDEYKRLDPDYVDNWRLIQDLHIAVRTFGAVVGSRGAR